MGVSNNATPNTLSVSKRNQLGDSEGSHLDDPELDLEAAIVDEESPLIRTAVNKEGETENIAPPNYTENKNKKSENSIKEGKGEVIDVDVEAGVTADAPAGRKKKKKKVSIYDSVMLAMGFATARIENAAEVQLYTSDQAPAGKVLIYIFLMFFENHMYLTWVLSFACVIWILCYAQVFMSIEIMHKSVADALPAGSGRSEPNTNPVLPEPEGRIDFSKMWNPFYACR